MRRLQANFCAAVLLTAAIFGGASSAGNRARSPRVASGGAPTGSRQGAGPIQYVILVSVDGLLPASYVEPDSHGLKVPTLRAMARDGAYSTGARSVFPTMTYPAHTSIATGTNPGTHGIVTNPAWDPFGKNQGGLRWYAQDIRVPTLWDAAMARGLRTAMVSWPVTVGARATALVPEYWRAGTPDDVKLLRALSTPRDIFDEVGKRFRDFLAGYTPPGVQDQSLADIAVELIETVRPNLLLLHIFQVDHWQHTKGIFSPEADAAIENADQQISRLIQAAEHAGTWNQTALVLVSDHGFASISKDVVPGVLLRKEGLITLDSAGHVADWKAYVIPDGGTAYLYVKDKEDRATRDQLLKIFLPLAGQPGSGIGRVYTQSQIAAEGGDPEAFVALEAADGYAFAGGYSGDTIIPARLAATHGYSPERPEMQASMLVYGPGIGHGMIPHACLIDVAPTIARWLGLTLDKAEGAPMEIPVRGAAR